MGIDIKLKALNETIRDLNRDILGIDRKMESVDKMQNPAQSRQEFDEIKKDLKDRIDIIHLIKKDIKGLDSMRKILVPTKEKQSEKDVEQSQP